MNTHVGCNGSTVRSNGVRHRLIIINLEEMEKKEKKKLLYSCELSILPLVRITHFLKRIFKPIFS
jgi:hypothetical protein